MRAWVILLSITLFMEAVISGDETEDDDNSEEYHEIEHSVATETNSKFSKSSSTVVKKQFARNEITVEIPRVVTVTTTTKAPPVTSARFSRRKKSSINSKP